MLNNGSGARHYVRQAVLRLIAGWGQAGSSVQDRILLQQTPSLAFPPPPAPPLGCSRASLQAEHPGHCGARRPTARFQRRMVESLEEDATMELPLLTARSVTSPSWPRQLASRNEVRVLQICTLREGGGAHPSNC